ncbi:MAG: hypothetical protein JNL96_12630 [Planctomycetaceae bacterium]|nr:hypothetical protein [Planctomycetaceae bacterium]
MRSRNSGRSEFPRSPRSEGRGIGAGAACRTRLDYRRGSIELRSASCVAETMRLRQTSLSQRE